MKLGKLTVRLRGRRAQAGACATVDWPRLAEALEPSRGRALRLIRRGVPGRMAEPSSKLCLESKLGQSSHIQSSETQREFS